ncbi:MAG: Ig-like domain-containing protein, partial [Bacteroidota bacterium]
MAWSLLLTFQPVSGQTWSWANTIQDASVQIGRSVATDPVTGAVYVAGEFILNLTPFGFTSAGTDDIVLARYYPDGTFHWAIQIGGTSFDEAHDLEVDSSGAVYMAGIYEGTVDFGGNGPPLNLTANGGSDAFFAKYDSLGRAIWAESAGGIGFDAGYDVAVYGDQAYFGGNYIFGISFDGGLFNLVSVAGIDGFVARYDTAGNFVWAQTLGGSSADEVSGLEADASGVYVSGEFLGNSLIVNTPGPPITLPNAGTFTSDFFVARLRAADGLGVWAIRGGGTSNDIGLDIAMDANRVYSVGDFQLSSTFGNSAPVLATGGTDAYLAAFDKATGAFDWVVPVGHPSGDDRAWDVTVNDGDVWWCGRYQDSLFLGGDTLPGRGAGDAFILRYSPLGVYVWSGYVASIGEDILYSVDGLSGAVYSGGVFNNFPASFTPSAGISLTNAGSTDIMFGKIETVLPPPVAVNDTLCLLRDSTFTVPVEDNDQNPGGGPLTLTLACTSNNGTAVIVGDSIQYTPNLAFIGNDTICYSICDSINQCDTAQVLIRVLDLLPDQTPTAIPVALNAGDLVIPMDTALQIDGAGRFNDSAYGLANALLQANIPLQWIIRTNKLRDEADFSATAAREFPTPLPSNLLSFFGGPLVIDSVYADSARIVIANYNNPTDPVQVYRLTQNIVVELRHLLTHKPRIAVFDNGGNQAIHTGYLEGAGVTSSHYDVIQASAVAFDSLSCYTFASQANWESSDPNDTLETRPVRLFLEYGGNFLAQGTAIETVENLEFFQTDSGIMRVPVFNEEVYDNADMPFLQVHDRVQNAGGLLPAFKLRGNANFLPGAYSLGRHPRRAEWKATARKIGNAPRGGNCFYLGGTNYGLFSNDRLNGRRMYLNGILVPPRRPNGCDLDFACDMVVTKTVQGSNFCVGDTVEFVIVAENQGPGTALDVSVYDTLSPSFTYVTHLATQGTYSPMTHDWPLGDQNFGSSDTLRIFATVNITGFLGNKAGVRTSIYSPDLLPSNDTASITISTSPTPDPTINAVAALCENGLPVNLTGATAGGAWSGPGVSGSTFDPTVTGAGSFSVQYSVTLGLCSATDSIAITVNPAPAPNLGPDTTICQGDSVLLDPGIPGPTFAWSTLESTPTITVNAAGLYRVTVTDGNNCSAADTIDLTVVPLPVVNLGGNQTICPGDSITLLSGAAGTYNWSTGATTPTVTVSAPNNYAVTVTDLNNCTNADSMVLSNFIPPLVNLGPDVSACSGQSVPLSANVTGSAYLWSTTATTPSISVTTPGAYSLTVTDANNCEGADTINVNFFALPTPDLGQDTVLCLGDSLLL